MGVVRAFVLGAAVIFATTTSIFAEQISLPEYHLAVSLPDGWQRLTDDPTGILIRAESDSGRLKFVFSRPPIPMDPAPVQNAVFQQGIRQSLIDHGFSKIIRSEVVKVAGTDAYLCEALREDHPVSIMQIMWFYEGHSISLVFLSVSKAFKDVPDVQSIIDSVKIIPKT